MKFTRRSFIKTAAAGTLAMATYGCRRRTQSTPAVKKILVLGGGYGGSTAAKYLKMLDPTLDVTLVDRNAAHVSCAMSNEVIFGLRDISFITKSHEVIANKYGVKFLLAEILGLDAGNKTVTTSMGTLSYDKLIVSPGISMDYDTANGFDAEMQRRTPHAWIGGAQTIQLRDMVANLGRGKEILIRTPNPPYRCPPGPYERSCLMAEFAQKNDCRVTVIDPNPGIVSKAPLFRAAFDELYSDVLTYIPSVAVKSYDREKNAIITDKGTFTADLINYVPEQKAGELAFTLGLVPDGGKWAPINTKTFESQIFNDVYVLGDATDAGLTGLPKSGTIANGMGKLIAENLIREFEGKGTVDPLVIGNSCFSLVSDAEGIYVATVYEYDPETNKNVVRNGANAIPEKRTEEHARNMRSWGENILSDTFD